MSHNELIGQIFGNLEVIAIGPTNKNRKKLLLVKCLKHPDVTPYYVVKQSLTGGVSKECVECCRERHTTHGKYNSRVYHAYKRMLQRIKDLNDKDYLDYGGRGIDMDPRYDPDYNDQGLLNAFTNFYNDIGDYQDPLTLDREDNSRGYWKDNIRLVTITEQARNKRNNVVNEDIVKNIRNDYANGMIQARICDKYNLTSGAVSSIINRKCWN